jgi:hypothetical protein
MPSLVDYAMLEFFSGTMQLELTDTKEWQTRYDAIPASEWTAPSSSRPSTPGQTKVIDPMSEVSGNLILVTEGLELVDDAAAQLLVARLVQRGHSWVVVGRAGAHHPPPADLVHGVCVNADRLCVRAPKGSR